MALVVPVRILVPLHLGEEHPLRVQRDEMGNPRVEESLPQFTLQVLRFEFVFADDPPGEKGRGVADRDPLSLPLHLLRPVHGHQDLHDANPRLVAGSPRGPSASVR